VSLNWCFSHRPLGWIVAVAVALLSASPRSFGATNPKTDAKLVRIVYLVPTDRPVRKDYVHHLEAAIEHLQVWFRNETGDGTTFSIDKRNVVEVVQTSQPAAWYSASPAGEYSLWFWNNVLAEAFALTGGMFLDPNAVWAFYIDSDPGCGQAVGATSGVALLPANDLRGLAGQPNIPPCAGASPDTAGVCRWVGGLGHELGHAFGLPHPRTCEDGDANTVCPNNALLWLGYITYPQTFLLQEDKTALAENPFFSAVHLRRSLPECSGSKKQIFLFGTTAHRS
jgi:hypothetical protein